MRVALDIPDDDLARFAGLVADALAERVPSSSSSSSGPWLTSAEAAERLRLSTDGLHRLTASGAVPHYKQGGRNLFHADELDEWIRDHYSGPTRAVSTPFPASRKAA